MLYVNLFGRPLRYKKHGMKNQIRALIKEKHDKHLKECSYSIME